MPQISALALTGDLTIAYTFAPTGITGAIASYEERLVSGAGISASFPKLTISLNRPSKTSRQSKVRMKMVLPVMEALDTTKVAYSTQADVTFFLPDACTLDDRTNLLVLFKSLLADAVTASLVQDLDSLY